MRDGLAWIGCRYVGAYTHRRTARGPSHSCAFHRGAYTRADAAGWNIYGSSIGERWTIARYTMSRSMCRRCDRLSYPLSGTGIGAAASRFGKLPRRTWEIVVEATVGRRRPKDSAPDLRGRLSRICGFGGFLPRAVSGAFFATADFQRSRREIHPHGVKLP